MAADSNLRKKIVNFNSSKLSDWSCLEGKEGLEQVEELHASFNYLSAFPQSLVPQLTSLCCLALNCNNLTSIPCLEGLGSLTQLQLANNQITTIEHLHVLPRLEELNLRCNQISCLENLTENTALRWLSLSGNAIHTFCWDTLPQLPELSFLGLYCNQLHSFEEVLQLLSLTPQLKELFVGCNPFSRHQPLSVEMQLLLNLPHIKTDMLKPLLVKIVHAESESANEVDNPKLFKLHQAVRMQLQMKQLCSKLEKIDGECCISSAAASC